MSGWLHLFLHSYATDYWKQAQLFSPRYLTVIQYGDWARSHESTHVFFYHSSIIIIPPHSTLRPANTRQASSSYLCDCGQSKDRLQQFNPRWSLPLKATGARSQAAPQFRRWRLVAMTAGRWDRGRQLHERILRQSMSLTFACRCALIHRFSHW